MPGDDHLLKKHSIVIAGHQTSITLENIFWKQLQKTAQQREISLNRLIEEIDATRESNLSSAIRVFILKQLLQDGITDHAQS